MDRRTFLGTISAAAILGRSLAWASDEHRISSIGLQLYTVREVLKKDFDGTLAKVAAIGYREVELGDFIEMPPKALRDALIRHGLTAPSTHVPYSSLGEQWPKVIEDAKVVGHTYIVNPWIDDEIRARPDGWKRAAATFNRAGEISKIAGIQFAYHNHWLEFIPTADGRLPYDILLEECDQDLVKMEMDLCWITVGGQDPLKYFARYPGRFPMVHVKDLKKVPPLATVREGRFAGAEMAEITEAGSGVIDWKRILSHSEQAGIKHYFVEHDSPKKPIESVRVSYEYLERLRF
ncbi:MAG: sugar phosphate isomerase/epimerase [Terriglobales bacterium]